MARSPAITLPEYMIVIPPTLSVEHGQGGKDHPYKVGLEVAVLFVKSQIAMFRSHPLAFSWLTLSELSDPPRKWSESPFRDFRMP